MLAAVMINAVVVVLEINHSAKLLQAKGVMVEGESLAFRLCWAPLPCTSSAVSARMMMN